MLFREKKRLPVFVPGQHTREVVEKTCGIPLFSKRAGRSLVIVFLALLLWPTLGAAVTPAPNIVFLLADDLGWTDLGSYGSGYYETPTIDRLVSEGMKFTDAYANPNCAPTRAALLTGRYAPRTGIYTVGSGTRGLEEFRATVPVPNRTQLRREEVTFAEVFRAAGYATAHIGKWHLGDGNYLPTSQGFDVNVAGNATGAPVGGYFSPYKNPNLPDGPVGELLTARLAAEAVSFIEGHRDRPFLLYLPFYAVHMPLQARPEDIARFGDKAPVGKHSNPVYAAMIYQLDQAVGKILETLDRLGLRERTIVVFYSDNGGVGGYRDAGIDAPHPSNPAYDWETTNNSPLRGGKGMLYEGGIRVPLVVRFPGRIEPGSVSHVPIGTVDMFPTLLDLAGIEMPENLVIDGTSFKEVLMGRPPGTERPPLFWHFPGYLEARPQRGSWRLTPSGAIRAGDFKLIESFETGQVELYDLSDDIGEKQDLAKTRPAVAAELHARLRAWRERLNAAMPERKSE